MTNISSLTQIAIEFGKSRSYTDVKFVGQGAFKETFRITQPDGSVMALKLSDPSRHNPLRGEREINALLRCNTPLIGKIFESGIFQATNRKNYPFLLEEYLDGGTLASRMEILPLPRSVVLEYAINLVQALDHLRQLNLVHRDIKPDNIMFRQNEEIPVLVDFGLVRDLSDVSLTQSFHPHGPGTPLYSAPEQLHNEKHLIGWETDQFSLGIVIGTCLTGYHPFLEASEYPQEAVRRMTDRQKCTPRFRFKINELNLGNLTKMIEPWRVNRYSSPRQILDYLYSVR